MDKYQTKFLSEIILEATADNGKASVTVSEDGNIVITQNEDYNITSYTLKLRNKDISGVSYYVNAWKGASVDGAEISVPIDFNNPTTILKVSLKDGLVDDFEAKVVLKPSDKAVWDEKHAKEIQGQRVCKMRPKLKSDGSLHSLIFSPCGPEYAYSIVRWYAITNPDPYEYDTYRKQNGTLVTKTLLEEVRVENKFYPVIK